MVIYKLRNSMYNNNLDFHHLSSNLNGIHILKLNMEKINWKNLPEEQKIQDNIDWCRLLYNPSIFIYDYQRMYNHFYSDKCYGKELVETLYNPKNFHKFGKDYWNIIENIL